MNELCLASYIKIMRVAFMQNDGNESATALITDAINTRQLWKTGITKI